MERKSINFIKENIAPTNTKKLNVYDENDNRVGRIALNGLTPPTGSKLYSFCALSDVHIGYDTADTDFQRALTFAENNCDFTCICGDLTASGNDTQLTQYKSIVDTYAEKPVYAVGGNHESIWGNMTTERIQPYTGRPLYYAFEQDNDMFVLLSHYGTYHGDGIGWLSSEFVTVEALQWLYETLEANRNKRCFVFNHVYPWNDGVGDAGRYYNGRYWLTDDGGVGQAFYEMLMHYKNVVLFHGHSHLRFSLQNEDKKANYADVGYKSVHIPSISVPRDRVDGTTSVVYAESEGYIVDVYDDYIILNGRDFIDNDTDGNILPIATYKIDTQLVTIEAGTFTDSTGIIVTN